MELPSAGSVILVSFPFSDLSSSKLRPAAVLAETSQSNFVLCQITSNPYSDPDAVELTDNSFKTGGLEKMSYARPGKLFTASAELFKGIVGELKEDKRGEIVEEIVRLLRSGKQANE
jgi:mRNA interferase MazF